MRRAQLFFYILLSFIAGVAIQSLIPVGEYFLFLALLIGVTGSIIFFKTPAKILFLSLLFFAAGMLSMSNATPQFVYENQEEHEFIGIVVGEPDVRSDKVKYIVKGEARVLINAALYPRYSYGDRLRISCYLQTPEAIEDFAYDKYLARHSIYSICYRPEIELLDSRKGNPVIHKILDIKNHFILTINKILPEPHGSFLGGLLVGAKRSIPDDLQEVFRRTGTSHIIAVSGYNVTIIAVFVMGSLLHIGISRKHSFWIVVVVLGVFTVITGLQASIIRATLMGILVLLAQHMGRASSIRNALALTAALMILINPWILLYDIGFQLSFLATLGLVYLSPRLEQLFVLKKISIRLIQGALKDYLIPTLSAIIMTAPLILYQFKSFSFVAPLANLLILPAIPLAMLLGFIAGLLGTLSIQLGWITGWGVWVILEYIISTLEFLSQFSWAYIAV